MTHEAAEAYAIAAYENYVEGRMQSAAVEAVMTWFAMAFGYGMSEVLLIAAQGARRFPPHHTPEGGPVS